MINRFKYISLFFLAIYFLGCKQKVGTTVANYGYINSNTFNEYLSAYQADSLKVRKNDINYFKKLELQDFLYGDSSSRFVVYFFAGFNNDSTYVYKVKEIGKEFSTSVSGFRESKLLNDTVHLENSKFLEKKIQMPKNFLRSLFAKLDSIKGMRKNKELMDFKYDDPFRAIFYYDGKDFYRFNFQSLSSSSLNNIDSFIRYTMFNGLK